MSKINQITRAINKLVKKYFSTKEQVTAKRLAYQFKNNPKKLTYDSLVKEYVKTNHHLPH